MNEIILETEGICLHAQLNHTVAAQEFARRMPLTLTCKKQPEGYCCNVARGIFEPNDLQLGWSRGDLLLWDGCFTIDLETAPPSDETGMTMVIGHTDEYTKLQNQTETIRLTIRAEDEQGGTP